jgi:tetratricopeptide (TPR) repeat protein
MSDRHQVADVVTAFLNSQDLHETMRLVREESTVFFSEAAEEYLDALLEEHSSNPGIHRAITTRRQLLEHCERDGIELAFANFFADLFPEPISDAAFSATQHMTSPDQLAQLVAAHPEFLPELQRASAAVNFANALTEEMQTPEAMADPSRRVALARAALRLVDIRLDPYMWAAVRGELASALAMSATGAELDEPIALLRTVQRFYADEGATELLSNALNNLGNALALRGAGAANDDLTEALSCLEQALALRSRASSPQPWAQTQMCLARARIRWEGDGRAEQIAMAGRHLELALQELSLEHTHDAWLQATMDLADILLATADSAGTDNFVRVIELLQPAILGANEDADDAVISMQLRLDRAYDGLAVATHLAENLANEEVLSFEALDGWYCASCWRPPGRRIEEWLPQQDDLHDWHELAAMEVRYGAGALPFRGLLTVMERFLRDKVTTGEFTFQALHESDDQLTYLWSAEGDFAIEDQYEIVLVKRGKEGLHRLRKAVRGKSLKSDRAAAAQWLEQVERAKLSHRLSPPQPLCRETPATADEIKERGERLCLGQPHSSPIDDPASFVKEVLRGVSRAEAPEMYAVLSVQAGIHLLQSQTEVSPEEIEEARAHFKRDQPPPGVSWDQVSHHVVTPEGRTSPAAIEAAIRALRWALEIVSPNIYPEIWVRGVANLARALSRRKTGELRRDLTLALHGFEQALEFYAERQSRDELGDILFDLGQLHIKLGDIGDYTEYANAIAYFSAALDFHTFQTHPLEWAQATFNRADVYRVLADLHPNKAALQAAESDFTAVVTATSSDERFKAGASKVGPDRRLKVGAADLLMHLAMWELQAIDRRGIPERRRSPAYVRNVRGKLLFLRPMMTSRNLVLENRFRESQAVALKLEAEPTVIPLESALYRALKENLSFQTIGGAPEGLGAGRIYSVGGEGWQDLAASMLAEADVILMLPNDSPGVRWEVEKIFAIHALAKVVFAMPPASSRMDVGTMWGAAVLMMQSYGLGMPPFRDDGLIFRLGEDGQVVESFPFDVVWNNTLFERLEPLLPATNS